MEQNYQEGLSGIEQETGQMEGTEVDAPIDVCYSFLMMPFYFDDATKITPKGKDSIWEVCNMTLDKGKLYNHIQRFIQSSERGKGDYQYYSLKDGGPAKFIRNMLEMPMQIPCRKQKSTPFSFRFNLEKKDSFFSPKLVICANARVGVLILSVSIISEKNQQSTIRQLCDLNYALFKTYKKSDSQKESTQNAHIYLRRQIDAIEDKMDVIKQYKLKISEWEEKENNARQQICEWRKREEELKYIINSAKEEKEKKRAIRKLEKAQVGIKGAERTINEKHSEKNKEELLKLMEEIRSSVGDDIINDIKTIDNALQPVERHCNENDEVLHYWTMLELTERLMDEFGHDSYCRFNPYRLHPFTYLRLNQNLFTPIVLDDFIRIINVQNRNYQVLSENSKNLYEQTFRNIYMGSSTEGGGIMTLLPEHEVAKTGTKRDKAIETENDEDQPYEFIKNFHNSSLSQGYIWIYLMVFVQRCTLLGVEKELSRFNFDENYYNNEDNTPQKREQLRILIKRMTQNEINTYFVDISDHTHHNKFYRLCSRNLQIEEYFTDVRRKTRTLKEYLSQLMDQRNEEMIARSEKITRIITIAGIVFALFSGLNDAFDLLGDDKLSLNYIIKGLPTLVHHLLIVLFFLLVPLLSWLLMNKYLHSSSKNNN